MRDPLAVPLSSHAEAGPDGRSLRSEANMSWQGIRETRPSGPRRYEQPSRRALDPLSGRPALPNPVAAAPRTDDRCAALYALPWLIRECSVRMFGAVSVCSGVARSVGGRGCRRASSGERFLERATAVVLLPVPSSIHVWPVGVAASVVATRSSSVARSVGAAFSGARVAPRV